MKALGQAKDSLRIAEHCFPLKEKVSSGTYEVTAKARTAIRADGPESSDDDHDDDREHGENNPAFISHPDIVMFCSPRASLHHRRHPLCSALPRLLLPSSATGYDSLPPPVHSCVQSIQSIKSDDFLSNRTKKCSRAHMHIFRRPLLQTQSDVGARPCSPLPAKSFRNTDHKLPSPELGESRSVSDAKQNIINAFSVSPLLSCTTRSTNTVVIIILLDHNLWTEHARRKQMHATNGFSASPEPLNSILSLLLRCFCYKELAAQ